MEWTTIATDSSGWTVAIVLCTLVTRAILRGDLVIGREYDRLSQELDRTSSRAETLAEEQRREAAQERGRLLAQIAALQAEPRAETAPESGQDEQP